MNQIKNTFRKRPLSDRVLSDYASRLRHCVKLLGEDLADFYRIKDPNKLRKEMERLREIFKLSNYSGNSINTYLTAFRAYIEAVQVMHDLKPTSKKYLKQYHESFQLLVDKSKNKNKATKQIITGLVSIFSNEFRVSEADPVIFEVLSLKKKKELDEIHKVVKKLNKEDYNLVVFEHFEPTAKVLAIKGLLHDLRTQVENQM